MAVSERAADVAARLADVRARIDRALARAGRSPAGVRLLAVTKGHDAAAVRAAYAAGQREFGENYVQELKRKRELLADLPDLRFRLIGRLQRNKAKLAAEVASAVDTLDSAELAAELAERAQASGRALEVLLQVNVDREPQKAGVLPERLPDLVAAVRALPALSLRGLMTVPRAVEDPEQARGAFAALRELARQHGLTELSMGMSADLEVAVEEGATIVRVGTAIFGPRPPKQL
jgi:pyridoxal phosphate enzyme (YggS family)